MVMLNYPENALTIRSSKSSQFKTIFSPLKDIIFESNISFDESGIKLVNMDKSHTIAVNLQLEAKHFEIYECRYSKIIIAVNMGAFYKILQQIEPHDSITIYIENKNYQDGIVTHLNIRFDGATKTRSYCLNLIEPETEELEYPDIVYSVVFNIDPTDFQKYIKDNSVFSDKLEISSVGEDLKFKCYGPVCNCDTEVKSPMIKSASSISSYEGVGINGSHEVMGVFSLKNLSYFTKCTNLSNVIELHLDNGLPLVAKYTLELGYMTIGISQLCQ